MPFKILKKYIIARLSEIEENENYDFQNSFSEILNRETSHEESVILMKLLRSCTQKAVSCPNLEE
jgi:hypothetical protein